MTRTFHTVPLTSTRRAAGRMITHSRAPSRPVAHPRPPPAGLVDRCARIPAREATLKELLTVHHPSLVDDIQSAAEEEAAGGEI